MIKAIVVFITLLLAIGVNLQDNMIARTGFESGVLTAVLVAIALTALLAYRSVVLIVAIVALVVGANLPADVAAGIHLDRTAGHAGRDIADALPATPSRRLRRYAKTVQVSVARVAQR